MGTLAVELPAEMQRVQELLPLYDAIPAGKLAATLMRQSLDRAARAAASGDVVAMIVAYEELKSYSA